MVSIGRGTVAFKLGINVRATGFGVLELLNENLSNVQGALSMENHLEDQDTRSFAHDEAISGLVKGA